MGYCGCVGGVLRYRWAVPSKRQEAIEWEVEGAVCSSRGKSTALEAMPIYPRKVLRCDACLCATAASTAVVDT